MAGAALTVLTQLAWLLPISRPFMEVLGWWMTLNSDLWLSAFDSLGFYPHSHVQAAIALAVFLATIGLGARVSAKLTGTPLERRWSLFEGQTWPSLAIMGTLGIIFLLGHDPNASVANYGGYGGKETTKYLFAIILAQATGSATGSASAGSISGCTASHSVDPASRPQSVAALKSLKLFGGSCFVLVGVARPLLACRPHPCDLTADLHVSDSGSRAPCSRPPPGRTTLRQKTGARAWPDHKAICSPTWMQP